MLVPTTQKGVSKGRGCPRKAAERVNESVKSLDTSLMALSTLRSEGDTPAVAVHGTISVVHTDCFPAPPEGCGVCREGRRESGLHTGRAGDAWALGRCSDPSCASAKMHRRGLFLRTPLHEGGQSHARQKPHSQAGAPETAQYWAERAKNSAERRLENPLASCTPLSQRVDGAPGHGDRSGISCLEEYQGDGV